MGVLLIGLGIVYGLSIAASVGCGIAARVSPHFKRELIGEPKVDF